LGTLRKTIVIHGSAMKPAGWARGRNDMNGIHDIAAALGNTKYIWLKVRS